MEQSREALIAKLVQESGLGDSEARRFLNALVVYMNEDLERLHQFTMSGVGTLTRAAETPDPSTGIKPTLTELGFRPLDAEIAGSEGAGLPLDEPITEVFLSDEGGEPAEAREGQGPGDGLNREP